MTTAPPPRNWLLTCLAIVGGLGVLAVVGVVGLFIIGRSARPALSQTVTIDYKVQGTAIRASLTYKNASGGTVQEDVNLPWEDRMEVQRGSFVYISAQNKGETGTITCTITANLVEYKRTTSSGAYKIAVCSGQVP